MKTILVTVLFGCALVAGGCSRSENQPDKATQTTPNPNLKSDAERLQQATAKAAEERKRSQASPAASAAQP
jgi:Na+-transporting methylmalonyl-CoA/oxaloacetate decarboxylase gamma subunit